jgi:hypothetical protein
MKTALIGDNELSRKDLEIARHGHQPCIVRLAHRS